MNHWEKRFQCIKPTREAIAWVTTNSICRLDLWTLTSGTGSGLWCWWIFNISSTSKCLQSRPYIWKDSPPKYSCNANILSKDILRNGDDIVWCTLTHVHSMRTHIAEISPRGDHNFGSTKMASVPGFIRHGAIPEFHTTEGNEINNLDHLCQRLFQHTFGTHP